MIYQGLQQQQQKTIIQGFTSYSNSRGDKDVLMPLHKARGKFHLEENLSFRSFMLRTDQVRLECKRRVSLS